MLDKKYPLFGIVAVVAISLGGYSLLIDVDMTADDISSSIVSHGERFDGVYPMPPPLPPANVLSNSVNLENIQNVAGFSILEPNLPKGFELFGATYNPLYDEATLFYAPSSVSKNIVDAHNIDKLLDMGVIIIDYERFSKAETTIDKEIARISQSDHGHVFNIDGKKGYFVNDEYADRQRVVIFDDGQDMEITIVYNKGSVSQVKAIAQSLFGDS